MCWLAFRQIIHLEIMLEGGVWIVTLSLRVSIVEILGFQIELVIEWTIERGPDGMRM